MFPTESPLSRQRTDKRETFHMETFIQTLTPLMLFNYSGVILWYCTPSQSWVDLHFQGDLDKNKGDELFTLMDCLSWAMFKALQADFHIEMKSWRMLTCTLFKDSRFGACLGYDMYMEHENLLIHIGYLYTWFQQVSSCLRQCKHVWLLPI